MKRYIFTIQAALFLVLAISSPPMADEITDFNASGEPVTITANTLSFDPDTKQYIAEGNVEIVQGKRVLSSDRATLEKDNGEARAQVTV